MGEEEKADEREGGEGGGGGAAGSASVGSCLLRRRRLLAADVRRDRNRKWPCRSLIDRFGRPRQLAPLWMLLLVPKLPVVILPGADCQSLQTQRFLRVGRRGRWRGFCHVTAGNDLTEFKYERKNFFFSQVALCNLIYFVSKDPPHARLNINK